jgi:hypothetical protein
MRESAVGSRFCARGREEATGAAVVQASATLRFFKRDRSTKKMFARTIQVDVVDDSSTCPCPLAWLDSFAMRSFTGRSAFDDVLPGGDGCLEVSFDVDLEALQVDMEDWFTRKFGQGQTVRLRLTEAPRNDRCEPSPQVKSHDPQKGG